MRILLVDDDAVLTAMLEDYLCAEGFEVVAVHNGNDALVKVLSDNYLMVVLDIMMPKVNGLEVLKRIRAKSQVPVLMLTAKGDDRDRIAGLELGADDYVPKPCTPRELTARIRAILRRSQNPTTGPPMDAPILVGELAVWPERRYAEWSGKSLPLTSTEFSLLEILVRNAGRAVSKRELSEQALGRELSLYDRNIDVHISSIRRKLGRQKDGKSCLHTVFRIGYQISRE